MNACGGGYGEMAAGAKRTVSLYYRDVEIAVVNALRGRAAEILELMRDDHGRQQQIEAIADSPEISKLRASIERLRAMDDDDLVDAIAIKTSQLNRLLLEREGNGEGDDGLKSELVAAAETIEYWGYKSLEERKHLYQTFVVQVLCGLDEIKVKLRC